MANCKSCNAELSDVDEKLCQCPNPICKYDWLNLIILKQNEN